MAGKHSLLGTLSVFCLVLVLAAAERHRGSQRERGSECQIDKINALEPDNKIRAEAGLTEIWNANEDQFQCAGVAVLRRTIEPRGLLLPSFTSAPELVYIVQGRGMQGVMMPGCPETYQSFQGSSQFRRGEEEEFLRRHVGGGHQSRRFQDAHQKIRRFRQGDIIALPAGIAHWTYNDGDEPIIAIVLLDTANSANQLDHNFPRRFYLAGNTEQEHQRDGQQQQQQDGEGQRRKSSESQKNAGNILSGFDTEFLAEAFGVSEETAKRLQGEEDERGNIVKVEEGLSVIKPPTRRSSEDKENEDAERGSSTTQRRRSPSRSRREGEEEEEREDNGLEEVICQARLIENIDDPSRADIFTPQAGRLSTLNSFNLPILNLLRLSATKGLLYKNAIKAPHYNLNANSVLYAVRGSCRMQIVNDRGEAVFDGEVRKGQLVTIPQNFASIKQASEKGFDWIEFQTNENAMTQNLAGRTSIMRSLPEQVVANMYRLKGEEARRVKFNRQETTLFPSSSQRSQRSRERKDDA